MGKLLNDKEFINSNIFKYEQRLESQYTIFLDKTPTFVTYYHINNLNSIVDSGFYNIEKVLGEDSPIRFQQINDFPIYGIESIKLDLNDEEEGITGNYEGEGIILPNTIKPVPNDVFIISYLDQDILFMVTSVDYDTIKSNNFYRISFYLRSLSEGNKDTVEGQVLEKYNCIFDNIGTDDKCLLKEDEYLQLIKLSKIYDTFMEKYKVLFYSKKFNSFLYNEPNNDFWYDKYLTQFINENRLFSNRDDYSTLSLSNEDYNDRFIIEYDLCFYSTIKNRDIENVKYINFLLTSISDPNSIFNYYHATKMKSVMFVDTGLHHGYIKETLIDGIKHNVIKESMSEIEKLIINYFNENIESIYNIEIDKLTDYKIRYDHDHFVLIPIILYILQYYTNKFMSI